jgi:Uma2 family endonuclease
MLALAVGAELRAQLQRQGGGVFGADLRVHSAYRQSYLYPDVSAVCGPQFHEQQPADTLVNPTLIVEVLSDSTESFDRGEKFRASQAITSLQHYALVSQHEPRIEVFTRATGGSWTLHSHGPGERIDFHAPECTLGIDEVYLGVPLTPAPPRG